MTNSVRRHSLTISASSSVKPVFSASWTLMEPFSSYKPNRTKCFIPMVSDARPPSVSSPFTLFVIWIDSISTAETLVAWCMDTGPRTPTDTPFSSFSSFPPFPFLPDEKAKTWPKLRTSIHFSQAIFAYSSGFFIPFITASARLLRLPKPSLHRSWDCTKMGCPKSCIRLRIFLLIHTSEISPKPSKSVRGRLPFSGSPLPFARVTEISATKSILFLRMLIPLPPVCFQCYFEMYTKRCAASNIR